MAARKPPARRTARIDLGERWKARDAAISKAVKHVHSHKGWGERMADGLTPPPPRHRARYWQARAERETDPEKQIRLREAAKILAREADKLEQREDALADMQHLAGEYR